jgi:hypothetical protein
METYIVGSIFKAFRYWFPEIQNIHCASHMMKNFLGLLYKADQKLGKQKHSMARKYRFLLLTNTMLTIYLGFRTRFERHLRHLLKTCLNLQDFELAIHVTIQHYKGDHGSCSHAPVR